MAVVQISPFLHRTARTYPALEVAEVTHPEVAHVLQYLGYRRPRPPKAQQIITGLGRPAPLHDKTSPEFAAPKARPTEEIKVEALQAQH